MNNSMYGECSECGTPLEPVWFIEEEYKTINGCMFKTDRKRRAVDYLICPCCLQKACVDNSFDGNWY